MFERVKHMLIKEFIQVFRDPRMRTVTPCSPLPSAEVTVPLTVTCWTSWPNAGVQRITPTRALSAAARQR